MENNGSASISGSLEAPLWVEQDQWLQASVSVKAARESARLQEAQVAMLSLEHFFIDCVEVGSVQFAWHKMGTEPAVLISNACGLDGEELDRKFYGMACAYARGQAGNLAKAWPAGEGQVALVVARERPFEAVGPILLGQDFFGSWMREREASEIRKGLGPSPKSAGKRPL